MNGDIVAKWGPISFSRTEVRDLLTAWIAISLAFTIAMGGPFLQGFVIAAITAGLGFLLHELGHKVVAQHYGAWAEFRSFGVMLLVGVALALFGIIFLAPGAVMISGRTIGTTRNGKISAAGPAMNFALALLFLLAPWPLVRAYGFQINAWLGLFNLIPFAPFDGAKVWAWNKAIYLVMVLVGIAAVGFSGFLMGGNSFA